MVERLFEFTREFVVGVLDDDFIGRSLPSVSIIFGTFFLLSIIHWRRETANDERGLRPGAPRKRRGATAHVAVDDERTSGCRLIERTPLPPWRPTPISVCEQVTLRELVRDRTFIL